MAQLQACLLYQQQQEEGQSNDDDLMPSVDAVPNDYYASWQNDCMLKHWSDCACYHVLRDLQEKLLSRQQQRDAQYILKCINELVGGIRGPSKKVIGVEQELTWDSASLLSVDTGDTRNSVLPKVTATLDEIMLGRRQQRTEKEGPKTATRRGSESLVSPKFVTYVKSCMNNSSKLDTIDDNDSLHELWDKVGRAPRDSTARDLLQRIRSLRTAQRQLLVDRMVQSGLPINKESHSRRGYALVMSVLVDDEVVDASRVPFESVPPFYSKDSLLISTENYLISSSLPNLNDLVSALRHIAVHNSDSDSRVRDVLEVVNRFREWLPSRPVFQICRAMLSDILSNKTDGKEQASKVSVAVEMLFALSGDETDGDWSIIFDRDFCQGILLPLRQRLCLALCTGQETSPSINQSRILLLMFERLLLQDKARRWNILQACPNIVWVLYLFSELPSSSTDDHVNEIAKVGTMSRQMKRLYDLSFDGVVLETHRAEDVFVCETGNSVILLPPVETFIQSLLDLSYLPLVDESASIDMWMHRVIDEELCWYDELADKLRSSWIQCLVDSGKTLSLVTQRLHQQFCRHYWGSAIRKSDNADMVPLAEVFQRALVGEAGGSAESALRRELLFGILQFTPSELLFAHCPQSKVICSAKDLLTLVGTDQTEGASLVLASVVSEVFRREQQSDMKKQSHGMIYDFLKPASPASIRSTRQSFDRIARQVAAMLADCDSNDGLSWWEKLCNDIERIEFPPSVHPNEERFCSEELMQVTKADSGRAPGLKRARSLTPSRGEPHRRVRASFETVIRQVWGDTRPTCHPTRVESDASMRDADNSGEDLSHDEYKDDEDDRVLLL